MGDVGIIARILYDCGTGAIAVSLGGNSLAAVPGSGEEDFTALFNSYKIIY